MLPAAFLRSPAREMRRQYSYSVETEMLKSFEAESCY